MGFIWRDETLDHFLHLISEQAGVKEQVEGTEHYVTPTTMALIHNLNAFFALNAAAMAELRPLGQAHSYPQEENLGELRAWSIKQSLEE